MPDKKLTDSEIKDALDVCGHTKGCTNCPLGRYEEDNCQLLLFEGTLDLINRLQAENERLKPFEDKIAEFKSHIRVEDMLVFANSLEEWLEFCDNLKAEAVTEFAEKLKAEYTDFDEENEVILPENLNKTINDLLKELVGDNDA